MSDKSISSLEGKVSRKPVKCQKEILHTHQVIYLFFRRPRVAAHVARGERAQERGDRRDLGRAPLAGPRLPRRREVDDPRTGTNPTHFSIA